jgi:hypothetical protein
MTKTIERRGGPAASMRPRGRRNRTVRAAWLALKIFVLIAPMVTFFGLVLYAWAY